MVNFTIDQIKNVMENSNNIRNFSVIAHVDHGKSTLTDTFLAKAGIIDESKSGDVRGLDIGKLEKEKGITIKSTGVSLYYEVEVNSDEYDSSKSDDSGEKNTEPKVKEQYLFNLIDSPGHVDFSSEVTAALRVTDGAIVVIDYVEGVCVQTETVLRQALQELIRPILVINKIDRAFLELQHSPETIYSNIVKLIEQFNICVSTYQNEDQMGDLSVSMEKGNVVIASGYQGWGFSLDTLADYYGKKFNKSPKKLKKMLWGNIYLKEGKFIKEEEENAPRTFCALALEPIIRLQKIIEDNKIEELSNFCKEMLIDLPENNEEKGKKLFGKVLKIWMKVSETLVNTVIKHLPSPVEAQKYRSKYLYNQDDECLKAMEECDKNGPLMMFISKMVPTSDYNRFYAFGRVFSGRAESKKVKIMGPNYKLGSNDDLYEKNIQSLVIMMGKKTEAVDSVPAGNTCALVGIDAYLLKQGTISDHPDASAIRSMKYSVSPVVRVAVEPKNPIDLPKFIEGLKKLQKSDPLVQIHISEKEKIIAGSGELHLEICLSNLYNEFTNNLPFIQSNPVVQYSETIKTKSKEIMTKSQNKHNRLIISAEPLQEELITLLENKNIEEFKKTMKKYDEDFDVKKLWSMGPEELPTNILVDCTSSTQYLNEIKDHIIKGFSSACYEGILGEEPLRGIRFNILDATIHSDKMHRGPGQITETARRAFLGCQLSAEPRLVEPIFLAEVVCPQSVTSFVYKCFSQRRGVVFEEEVTGNGLVLMKATLPVVESFGFQKFLMSNTGGKALLNCSFDHWEILDQDVLDPKSEAYIKVMEIRKRKLLKLEIPKIEDFSDKL